jgi:protein TonB
MLPLPLEVRRRALALRLARPTRTWRAPRWLVVSLGAHALAISAYAAWSLASPAAPHASQASPVAALEWRERAEVFEPAEWSDASAAAPLEPFETVEEALLVEADVPPAPEAELQAPQQPTLEPLDVRASRIPARFASLARAERAAAASAGPVAIDAPPAPLVTPTPAPPPRFVAAAPRSELNERPEYPKLARARGWEGTTLLQLSIDAGGRVANARVLVSSGHEVLDRAALDAVASWSFIPARRGDTAVASSVEAPIVWRLAKR